MKKGVTVDFRNSKFRNVQCNVGGRKGKGGEYWILNIVTGGGGGAERDECRRRRRKQ